MNKIKPVFYFSLLKLIEMGFYPIFSIYNITPNFSLSYLIFISIKGIENILFYGFVLGFIEDVFISIFFSV